MTAQPESDMVVHKNGNHVEGEAAAVRTLIDEPRQWPLHQYQREAGFDWLRLINAWLVLGLAFIEVVLAFRLGFMLASANFDNGFVEAVYGVSGPLSDPFKGIIAESKLGATGIFDPSILVAMLAYLAAAILLSALAWAIVSTNDAREGRWTRERPQEAKP